MRSSTAAAELLVRTDSYNSETGSFWNFSANESDTASVDVPHEEIQPLGIPARRPRNRHQSISCKPQNKVQDLSVRHVIGFSKESTSTPLVFGPDGLVAYLAGCFVTIFDCRTNCQVQHLCSNRRKRAFACLAISRDANILAAGEEGQDPMVVIWRIGMDQVAGPVELKGHTNTITAISFSPNGKYLATAGNPFDSQLILWDCQMETALCSQLIHIQANLTSLSFSIDSKALYTSGTSHFTMWHLCEKTGRGGGSAPGMSLTSKPAMPTTEKGIEIVDVRAGGSGKSSFIFAISKNGILYKLGPHKGGMTIVKKTDLRVSRAFSLAVGVNKIAVSCANGVVKIIRIKTWSVEATIQKPIIDAESSSSTSSSSDALYCAFDHQSSSLAVAYADNSLTFWDVEDTTQSRPYHTIRSPLGSIRDIFSIAPSESQKAVERKSIKAIRSPNIHNPQAVESEFATCSESGTISLWNLKMHSAHPRSIMQISPASGRQGIVDNPSVEIEVQTIDTNPPPASKSKATRRTKAVLGGVKSSKETKRSVKTKPLASKTSTIPKKVTAKKPAATRSAASTSKKTEPKKKTTNARPAQRGKRLVGTPGAMGLSTDLTDSSILQTPVVAFSKPGHSRSAAADAEPARTAPAEDVHLTCLRTSPDSVHLVVGDSKGYLRIYHMPSMKLMSKKAVHKSPITVIEFSLPGKRGEILLATGAEDGSVAVMEVHNDFEVVLEKEDHTETVTGLSFSPEGKAVVSCGRDNYLYYESLSEPNFDCDEEDVELFLSRHFLMSSTFEAMHFNIERGTYMLACSDNFIRVFNAMGQFVHTIQIPEELGAPTKILQGSIPTMIVTCHANNKIGVFEYFTGRLLAVGEGHSKLTGALLINNGRNLVTTGDDGVMVIWELHEELRRMCLALPVESGIPQNEAGYANEFFLQIQLEKERASKAANEVCHSDAQSCKNAAADGVSLCEKAIFSGASTPLYSRPTSRMSEVGLPLNSPVAQTSNLMMIHPRERVRLPSWMSKGDDMSDDGLMDGFESRSPSIYSRPPKLDLGNISDTDDEGLGPLPVQINRSQTLLNHPHFQDLDSLPVDHFIKGPGFSRRGLSLENDRFNRPADSMHRGRRSTDSYSGFPAFNLQSCSSLAQYQDERSNAVSRGHYEDSDRAFGRPTGPEPPSSVSCTSDSRTGTPFSIHPRNMLDGDSVMQSYQDSEGNDEQFAIFRNPFGGNGAGHGPIGPNIRHIASRTPTSTYSDDKTVYIRPNSEEHTTKMLAEYRPTSNPSSESVSHVPSPFMMGRHITSWGVPLDAVEDVDAYSCESDNEQAVPYDDDLLQQHANDVIFAGAESIRRNPLYSSRSSASDLAHYQTRPMMPSNASLVDLPVLEQEMSVDALVVGQEGEGSSPVRKSTEMVWKAVESTITESLLKLKEKIGHHKSLADCQLPTYRKQQFVDKAHQELTALLEHLQGHSSNKV